jgi:twitching motility protein PilU
MAMKRLLELMAEKKASDIFISVGTPIAIKINGVTMPINQQIVKPDTVRALMQEILTERQLREFEENFELNTSYPITGLGSFRISAFMQRTTPAIVVRYIPGEVPGFDTLGLPAVLKEVVMEKRGLILMVGATGSGKSTSLAAMIDLRNAQKSGHIITIEDPIEFLFKHKKSIVNQRELGTDAKSYQVALKNALRQAPDVILIGEIRDRETMTMAIAYAQSGHLCLATLHANNSYHALNRIISFYPLENRPALLQDLSATLKCVISQRLVPNVKGTRSPAVEVLLNTRHIAELIEQGEVNEIKEAMEKSMSPGSQTFEQSLFKMIRDGVITQEEGLAYSDSANNLLWQLNNAAAAPGSSAAQPAAPKEPEKPVDKGVGGASFSEFKLSLDDEKAA